MMGFGSITIMLIAWVLAVGVSSGDADAKPCSRDLIFNVTIENSSSNGPFLLPKSFNERSLLQPDPGDGVCADDTAGNRCCYDPCEAKPCFNSGTCEKTRKGNGTFTCNNCAGGFIGKYCEVPKTCEACEGNTDCTDEGKCVCKEGYEGNSNGTDCTPYCPSRNMSETALNNTCPGIETLSFTTIAKDFTAYSVEKCADGRPIASMRCEGIEFDEASLTCVPCNYTLETFLDQADGKQYNTSEQVKKDVEVLKVISKPTENNTPEQTKNVVNALENMASAMKADHSLTIDTETFKDLLDVSQNAGEGLNAIPSGDFSADDIEGVQPQESEEEKSKRNSTSKLPALINDFAHSTNLSGEENKTIISGTITVMIYDEPKADTDSGILTIDPPQYITSDRESVKVQRKVIKVDIPENALNNMERMAVEEGTTFRLVVVLYQDATHLSSDRRTGQVVQGGYKRGEGGPPQSLGNGVTFEIIFHSPPEPDERQYAAIKGMLYAIHKQYFCVFWDYRIDGWSTDGCQFFHGKPARCECNHFTSFALLLRTTVRLVNYGGQFYSSFACGLSAVCLIVTAVIYLVVKDLRTRRPTPILVNICINLIIGYVMFIVGMDGRARGFSDPGCYVSAVIMHIAFLCAWFWILIYALNMYFALVKVIGGTTPVVGKKLFMYLVGYGLPIAIVAVDLGAALIIDENHVKKITDDNFEDTYIASHICWLRHFSMYLGFAGPVGIILVVNIVLFSIIMKSLTNRQQIQSSKKSTTKADQVYTGITMMMMMGLTWILGYIMLISSDPTFQTIFTWIFNILNTAQGIVIFFVSCLRQPAVRTLWMEPLMMKCGCGKCVQGKKEDLFPSAMTRSTPNSVGNEYTISSTHM